MIGTLNPILTANLNERKMDIVNNLIQNGDINGLKEFFGKDTDDLFVKTPVVQNETQVSNNSDTNPAPQFDDTQTKQLGFNNAEWLEVAMHLSAIYRTVYGISP